ncbi:TPA: hypothetical protein DDZ86_04510 [Candidatus Dependentiae bacterium]|nr:MAG: hypothetical protein UW09_C0002G0133 [candidate division TM6 bacterium GW2011_GWF2_43_87]HBL98875.1 hypothetical protein [Candidatus Dependentiae bacterium]
MKTLIKLALLGAVVVVSQSTVKAEIDLMTLVSDAAPSLGDFIVIKDQVSANWNSVVSPMIEEIRPQVADIISIVYSGDTSKAALNKVLTDSAAIVNTLSKPEYQTLLISVADKLKNSQALRALLVKYLQYIAISDDFINRIPGGVPFIIDNTRKLVEAMIKEFGKPQMIKKGNLFGLQEIA